MASGEWGGAFQQRVFRANIQFRHGGQNCQTGFHIRDVGINTLSPEDVANEVADFATTDFIQILHQTDQVVGIDVMNLVTSEGFAISPANAVGAKLGTPCPSFLQLPVSIKGNLRKRYGNGRMLWPVYNIESMTGNVLVPAAVTAFQGVITAMTTRFMSDGVGATMRLVHLHGALPAVGTRPAIPAQWYDATSLRLATVVSSLRRRKAGVGS